MGPVSLQGIGVDVTDVGRIDRLVKSGGGRFVRRWFTPQEVAESSDPGGQVSTSRLALRFAAKEAVWKALGEDGRGPVPWRLIEVLTAPSGGLAVSFTGALATRQSGDLRIHVNALAAGATATAFAIVERARGREGDLLQGATAVDDAASSGRDPDRTLPQS